MWLYVWNNSGHCFKEKGYEYVRWPGREEVPVVATQDGLVGTEMQYYL